MRKSVLISREARQRALGRPVRVDEMFTQKTN